MATSEAGRRDSFHQGNRGRCRRTFLLSWLLPKPLQSPEWIIQWKQRKWEIVLVQHAVETRVILLRVFRFEELAHRV